VHSGPSLTTSGPFAVVNRDLVERTIAWLNRCRRLAKDWENLNRKALAFLRLASIRLMLRKLCNPRPSGGSWPFNDRRF
jgi:transposase